MLDVPVGVRAPWTPLPNCTTRLPAAIDARDEDTVGRPGGEKVRGFMPPQVVDPDLQG